MILRITDAGALAGRALVISTEQPPPELVEELAKAGYNADGAETLDQTAPGVHEAYRQTVRRILKALAAKVQP